MVSYLQVEHLTKSFGDKLLFENISFGLHEGQRMAIIAKNGAGKSTLLNILVGKEDYDDGNISYRNDLRIGFLPQSPCYEGRTVKEVCFSSESEVVAVILQYEEMMHLQELEPNYITQHEGEYATILARMDELNAWDYETRIKQILGKLDINNLDQPVSELSGGQQKRIALANVLITDPDLLILDEPTNHLDLSMVEWLEDVLVNSHMALLIVTHDRYFLDRVCSDIIEIDNQHLYHYQGNYSYYLEKRDERIENFNAATQRIKGLYRKELEWMRRQPQARGTKAQSRIDAFRDIEQRAKMRLEDKRVHLGLKPGYIGSKIFEAQYISKKFDDKKILDHFYYNFSRYEKLGIIGRNGTGKSTFLKLLLGKIPLDEGRFDVGETVRFGYYSQEGLHFDEQMKVIDVVRKIAETVEMDKGHRISVSQFLSHFLFEPERQYDYVYKLSGGERRRLYLCTVLMQNPNFLVLDEPTNDLDIATLNVLENYLAEFHGCLIVVSHDRFFMDKVVDHLLVFEGDAQIKDFPGNYTDYRQWRQLKDEEEREILESKLTSTPAVEQKKWRSESNVRKMTYAERMEFEKLGVEIEQLEEEKSHIEQQLSEGGLTGEELLRSSSRFGELSNLIDEKTMRWLELSELS